MPGTGFTAFDKTEAIPNWKNISICTIEMGKTGKLSLRAIPGERKNPMFSVANNC